jgi:hypothetical protein
VRHWKSKGMGGFQTFSPTSYEGTSRQYQIGAQVVKKLEATGHEAGIAFSAHGYRRGRVAGSGACSRHRFMEVMDAVPYWTTRQQA